ncbi:MAG: peptidoglycan recognition family protein [Elusimicrobiota bacterium]
MSRWAAISAALLWAGPVWANDAGESVRFRGQSPFNVQELRPAPGKVLFETKDSDQPDGPYDSVLIHGVMPDRNLRLEVAVSTGPGARHDWLPILVKRFPGGRFWAKYKFPALQTSPLRLRAVDIGINSVHVFELYDVELFVAGTGPESEAVGPMPSGHVRISTGSYLFVDRQEWGAAAQNGEYVQHLPVRMTMHHTAGRKPDDFFEAAREMRFIQDYHVNGRGWMDIGYHFVISPQGVVFQGRPESVVGSHVLGHNTGNIGISFMGNYHPPVSDGPQAVSLQAFVAVARRVAADYNIGGDEVRAHREMSPTDCPGEALYARFPELKARIALPPAAMMDRLPKRDWAGAAYLNHLPW